MTLLDQLIEANRDHAAKLNLCYAIYRGPGSSEAISLTLMTPAQ